MTIKCVQLAAQVARDSSALQTRGTREENEAER